MSKFEDLSNDERLALQSEFEHEDTARERRIEILELVREGANEAGIGYQCPRCKNFPFYVTHDEGLIEGHVYSREGYDEISITRYCEFCFDLITAEPEEEEETEDDYQSDKDEALARDEEH